MSVSQRQEHGQRELAPSELCVQKQAHLVHPGSASLCNFLCSAQLCFFVFTFPCHAGTLAAIDMIASVKQWS